VVLAAGALPSPAHAGDLPPLLVSARLYAWRGHWVPVDQKQMVNSEPLRIAVQVLTPYGPARNISARYALRHVSWQRFHRVVMPADVNGWLRQTAQKGTMAHFERILRLPVTHPLQFSEVLITVRAGKRSQTVSTGVTIEPPMKPSEAPVTLTVPQVFSFCAARNRLLYLSYGLAVRAYIQGVPTGGDGPAEFLVLSRRTPITNLTALAHNHEGFRAGGFVNPPPNQLVTISGSVTCRPQIGMNIVGTTR
jgi:hypothetical protein